MLTFKVVLGAGLALVLFVSLWLNAALHRERRELETALEASQSRVEDLQADIRRQAEALAERETKIARLANEKYRLNKRLKEAVDREQEVREWAYDRVPDAVCGILREKRQPPARAGSAEQDLPESWNRARIIRLPDGDE